MSQDGDAFYSVAPPSEPAVVGTTRKQNVACDACRAKKVRCQRNVITETCTQCQVRGSDCTSNYVEQLQAKAKNGTTARKRRRKEPEDAVAQVIANVYRPSVLASRSNYDQTLNDGYGTGMGETSRTGATRMTGLGGPESYAREASPSSSIVPSFPSQKQFNLLRYLFSPYAVTNQDYRYNDISSKELCALGKATMFEEDTGRVWSEEPSEAHLGLNDGDLQALAEDLFNTFLKIVHTRIQLLDPDLVRAQFENPDTHTEGPLSHSLLAVILAFGARFSTNPIITSDRQESTDRQALEGTVKPKSRMIQLLVIRAKEVVEVWKCHRIASVENAHVLIYLENLLGEVDLQGSDHRVYYASAAARHILSLSQQDSHMRTGGIEEKTAEQLAWATCVDDAFRAVFHRTLPVLTPHLVEYNNMTELKLSRGIPYSAERANQIPTDWIPAAAESSRICRHICEGMWSPRAVHWGIPLSMLYNFVEDNRAYKTKFLAVNGISDLWAPGWGLTEVLQTCVRDLYHHTLWLVVNRGIDDNRIEETHPGEDADDIRSKIRDEAEHAAFRITALISVLLMNKYLQLDPLIFHHPIYEAGMYLARNGRMEFIACVAGMKQYCIAYPQFWHQAEEMEEAYELYKAERGSLPEPVPSKVGGGNEQAATTDIDLLSLMDGGDGESGTIAAMIAWLRQIQT